MKRILTIIAVVAIGLVFFTSCETSIEENGVGKHKGHEYVDLGLPSGLKWATCNVGANTPEEYGYYFAWGEVEPKTTYDWSTYEYGTDWNQLTKYCNKSDYGKDGFTDNKTVLDPEDDAATANWGGAWRMPTTAEQQELVDNCTWTWTTQNGVNGYKVVGPNGNSIFFPAAGVRQETMHLGNNITGYYWTCTPGDSGQAPGAAHILKFNEERGYYNDYVQRHIGMPIRPVSL